MVIPETIYTQTIKDLAGCTYIFMHTHIHIYIIYAWYVYVHNDDKATVAINLSGALEELEES